MKRAAFTADYVDLRFIKSRKCAQIVVEIPIEQAAEFVAAFGAPNPATGVPVALARIDPSKVIEASPEPAQAVRLTEVYDDEIRINGETIYRGDMKRRKFGDLPLVVRCAMTCEKPAFWQFLLEEGHAADVLNAEQAATYVRGLCEVKSRSEIIKGSPAGDRWEMIERNFDAWMRVIA